MTVLNGKFFACWNQQPRAAYGCSVGDTWVILLCRHVRLAGRVRLLRFCRNVLLTLALVFVARCASTLESPPWLFIGSCHGASTRSPARGLYTVWFPCTAYSRPAGLQWNGVVERPLLTVCTYAVLLSVTSTFGALLVLSFLDPRPWNQLRHSRAAHRSSMFSDVFAGGGVAYSALRTVHSRCNKCITR